MGKKWLWCYVLQILVWNLLQKTELKNTLAFSKGGIKTSNTFSKKHNELSKSSTPTFLTNVRFLVKNEGKKRNCFGYFGLIILLRLQETYLKLMAILFLYTWHLGKYSWNVKNYKNLNDSIYDIQFSIFDRSGHSFSF